MAADPHDPAAPEPAPMPEPETDAPWQRRTWLRRVIGGAVELALNPFGRVLAAGRAAAPLAGPVAEGAASATGTAALATARTTATGAVAAATASHTGPAAGAALARHPLRFPADLGAHPEQRTEWWYVTGWLAAGPAPDTAAGAAAAPTPRWGFQITFFRSRTDVAPDHPSAFAARQLIMAHAALTELPEQPGAGGPGAATGRLRHDQRIARAGFGLASAAEGDLDVTLRGWWLRRGPDTAATGAQNPAIDATPLHARLVSDAGFALDLTLQPTQPRLLQGEAGWSRKGPDAAHVSLYVSEPQLRVSGRLDAGAATGPAQALDVHGRAWLDHEWSESVLAPEAVGWDWIGMNLLDGSALTAFRLRRADGSTLWAGGSWRAAGSSTPRVFTPNEVIFTPLRHWRSPATGTRYPVEWQVATPAGNQRVRALLDAQELDSRASTGTIYWEGLSELLDAAGRRIGLGYLELTGYAGTLKL